jgi:hypothetical protein
VPAFVALSTEFDSDQWKQIEALGAKFPAYASLLAQGREQLSKQGLDFDQDVRPALGPEVDVAWLDLKNRDDYVLVTKPSDTAKLDALVQKASPPPARADVNGYAVLAQSKTLVDSVSSATSHLSDDPSFEEAMAALPAGGAVQLYLNGSQVQSALADAAEKSASAAGSMQLDVPPAAAGKLDWFAATGRAESDGVRLDGVAKVEPTPNVASFKADLPSDFAAGAILYAGFANLDDAAKAAVNSLGTSSPDLSKQLGQLEGVSGLSLDNDIAPLLKNEGAVAVYPSTEKTPTIVFALKVDDEAKVQRLLDQVGALAALAGGGSPTAVSVAGYPDAKELKLGTTSIFYGLANGKLVISNSDAGLRDVGGSGPKLADDALFKAAKDGAKMPDETTGFVYADLKAGLPLVAGAAQSQGTTIPLDVKQNTAPLQSALFYGTSDGDLIRITGFAGVQ